MWLYACTVLLVHVHVHVAETDIFDAYTCESVQFEYIKMMTISCIHAYCMHKTYTLGRNHLLLQWDTVADGSFCHNIHTHFATKSIFLHFHRLLHRRRLRRYYYRYRQCCSYIYTVGDETAIVSTAHNCALSCASS